MSTSSDFSWASTNAGICSFEYPSANPRSDGSVAAALQTVEQKSQELQRRLQQTRVEGEREGELRARKVFEDSLCCERERIGEALAAFQQERKSYFQRVEMEVVQLALAISRRILHREAQVDKSLLAGMVRVTIAQLSDTTGIALRVHPSRQQEWMSFFANSELKPSPEVVGDPDVPADRCVVSTQLGSTEVGIEPQLKEIEQGLFDLMAQRPGV